MMDSLEKKIYEKIIEKMELDESELEGFTENSPIFEPEEGDEVSLNLDSLDSLELLVLIYDEWGITVPSEDVPELSTIKKVAEYIREHSGK